MEWISILLYFFFQIVFNLRHNIRDTTPVMITCTLNKIYRSLQYVYFHKFILPNVRPC